MDTDNICKLNKAYQWEVFSCLTQSGIIEAQTAKPLLLKFQPRMFGTYKVLENFHRNSLINLKYFTVIIALNLEKIIKYYCPQGNTSNNVGQ